MNPAGLVLIIAGLWVTAQVTAGNALQRLNIVKPPAAAGGGGASIVPPNLGQYAPGGSQNPPYVDLNRIFGQTGGGVGI